MELAQKTGMPLQVSGEGSLWASTSSTSMRKGKGTSKATTTTGTDNRDQDAKQIVSRLLTHNYI